MFSRYVHPWLYFLGMKHLLCFQINRLSRSVYSCQGLMLVSWCQCANSGCRLYTKKNSHHMSRSWSRQIPLLWWESQFDIFGQVNGKNMGLQPLKKQLLRSGWVNTRRLDWCCFTGPIQPDDVLTRLMRGVEKETPLVSIFITCTVTYCSGRQEIASQKPDVKTL